MPDIELEDVSKIYRNKRQNRRRNHRSRREVAVEKVNLTIAQGEFVFIVGSRGAGKTTLLQLICGEVRPSRGAVYLDGDNMKSLRLWHRGRLAESFGRVFQRPALDRRRTIGENLERAVRATGWLWGETRSSVQQRVNKALGLVGLSGSNDRFPVELSMGEVRRAELARALINSPSILVLDELTSRLDDDNIWDMFQLLKEINEKGTTVIMATHASRYVNIMHRRVVTLVDGHIYGDVKYGKYGDVV